MTTEPLFRLLDPFIGWDLHSADGIDGRDDDRGLRLTGASASVPQLTRNELDSFIPPAWLACGARPGEWVFLGTSADGTGPRVYLRDRCEATGRDITPLDYDAEPDGVFTAIAYRRGWLAGSLRSHTGCAVVLWSETGARLATIPLPATANVFPTFAPWCELAVLVQTKGTTEFRRYAFDGTPLDRRDPRDYPAPPKPLTFPFNREIERIGSGTDGAVWFTAKGADRYDLWRIWPCVKLPESPLACGVTIDWGHSPDLVTGPAAVPAQVRELARLAFPVIGPTLGHDSADRDVAFCIPPGCGEGEQTKCLARTGGAPINPADVLPQASTIPQALTGWVLTAAIDSFLPRCRWHRLRVEMDPVPGVGVRVAVASSDEEKQPTGNPLDPTYEGDEVFHKTDWQRESCHDFLIDQPPGRYLFVALAMEGNVNVGPVVRQVRLDFPRATSLDRLPAVYREDPDAEDFTERFLSLFDAALEDFDRAIERFSVLLDSDRTPESVLRWLGDFLGVELDPDTPPELRRKLLGIASSLARRRGTVIGLGRVLAATFGISEGGVSVRQFGAERPWGAIGGRDLLRPAVLGSVRLFPQRENRFRLGRSAVGKAALRSDGDAADDVTRYGTFRVAVAVPDAPAVRGAGEKMLGRVIGEFVPGHVVASVRVGGTGFVVGQRSVLGIDTAFGGPPPAVLAHKICGRRDGAGGTAVLNRRAVLRSGRQQRPKGLRVGEAMVGIHTVLE